MQLSSNGLYMGQPLTDPPPPAGLAAKWTVKASMQSTIQYIISARGKLTLYVYLSTGCTRLQCTRYEDFIVERLISDRVIFIEQVLFCCMHAVGVCNDINFMIFIVVICCNNIYE